MNHRLDEFRAALGVVQMRRMPEIVSWKQRYAREVLDLRYPNRVQMPNGMESGYYKYIVFDEIPQTTGRVYELPCHEIFDSSISLPNTEWATNNHWCVPRSEEHTSELQSLMRISYAVFCLQKK